MPLWWTIGPPGDGRHRRPGSRYAAPVLETTAPGTPAGWRTWLPAVLVAFVASRIVLLVVVALVEASFGWPYARDTVTSAPLLGSLTSFDSVYYLGIAGQGYHVAPIGSVGGLCNLFLD